MTRYADIPTAIYSALDAHSPENGRVTIHPSPGASAPPALAQGILYALGKRLPPHDMDAPRHRALWQMWWAPPGPQPLPGSTPTGPDT
ncbi:MULTISPECIES: hypothetical protein [unclassified Streptomyces]|uniref:hypothetical protein n=1 Tax=unclassified Streptomyces TaxID=2593676 RepID=UPI0032488EE1